MAEASLLVVRGVDQGMRFRIETETVGIGRGVHNQIRILDTEVSRSHAQIRFEDRHWLIEDLKSSNGTFVNGDEQSRLPLRSGDEIHIGRTALIFTIAPKDARPADISEKVDLLPYLQRSDESQIVSRIQHEDGSSSVTATRLHDDKNSFSPATLDLMFRISEESVQSSLTLEQMLKRILSLTIEAVDADRGCLLLSELGTTELTPFVFSHRKQRDPAAKMPISRTIIEYVTGTKQGVHTSDALHDGRFEPGQSILKAGIREAMCVPIQGRSGQLGVIYVDTTSAESDNQFAEHENRFGEEHLRVMLSIGRQCAMAIENSRFRESLLQAERLAAIGQTIAILSHHIKNILQGIRGGSFLIEKGLTGDDNDMTRQGWKIVEKNQDRIYNLVMDMLTFSKERKPEVTRGNVGETVAEVVELMQSRAAEMGVRLEYVTHDVPDSVFDQEAIHRAALNIIINAVDAAQESKDGEVVVTTEFLLRERALQIRVADNGTGIEKSQLKKVFNLFESTKGSRGTGLGLAVSQKIAREHDGHIDVESDPNKGAVFTIVLPYVPSTESETMSR